jgi:exopolysaccharide production protein ExoQ
MINNSSLPTVSLRKAIGSRNNATTLIVILSCVLGMAISAPIIETIGGGHNGIGLQIRRIWYPAMATILLVYLLKNKLNIIRSVPVPVFFALSWYWLSLTWSQFPQISLVRLILTTLITWMIFSTVHALRTDRTLTIVRYILALALFINYAAVFTIPHIGILQEETGNWQGLMTEKNQAGMLCGVTCLFWILYVPEKLRLQGYAISLLSAVFLIMTISKTAIIMTLMTLVVYRLLLFSHQRDFFAKISSDLSIRIGLWLGAAITCIVTYLTFFSDILPVLVQDPEFMSKRGAIWQPMVQMYLQHPLAGIGFGSLWGASTNDRQDFGGSWLYRVSQGHNGFLDIAVQAGAIGLILGLIATFVWPVVQTVRQMPLRPYRAAFAFSIVFFCLGSNFTESGLFDRDRLWYVFLILSLSVMFSSKRTLDSSEKSLFKTVRQRRPR